MNPQTILSPTGEEMVVLSKAEYEALVDAANEAVEDAADVAIYDARMTELGDAAPMPTDLTMSILRGDGRLKAIRKWRSLSQVDLADRAGLAQGFLSDLENRKRSMTQEVAARLARALDVSVDWIA